MPVGKFIAIEGGEGTGKSTLGRHLHDYLRSRSVDVILTREPGGSEGADQIRQLLVTGPEDRWDPLSETLLIFAARRDHMRRTILPALKRGIWVLSDRFTNSTTAYQGFGHGIDRAFLAILSDAVTERLKPDLTFVLDAPSSLTLDRARARESEENRFEAFDLGFHERARQGFLKLATLNKADHHILDATRPFEEMLAEATRVISANLV